MSELYCMIYVLGLSYGYVKCYCLIISHCRLGYNDLTATGAIALVRALQHKSLEVLK